MKVLWGRNSRSAAVAAAAVAGVLLLSACGPGDGPDDGPSDDPDAGSPVAGGDLVVGTLVGIPSFDPAWCAQPFFPVCNSLYGSLISVDPATNEITPRMAESVESEDGQVWTIVLREGVTFSDGTPYDADAVAYNWDRFADPTNLSQAASVLSTASWEAVDDTTVRLTLDAPDFTFAPRLQYELGSIASPTALETLGDGFGTAPVGAGPFVLDMSNDVEVVLVRNPDYWDEGRPYLDSLTIRTFLDPAQRADSIRSGSIDGSLMLDPVPSQELEAEGYVVNWLDQVGGVGVGFNLRDEDFADQDLRMALLKSMDADQINIAVPHLAAATAFLPPDSPFRDDAFGTYPEMDLEAAQDHLNAFLERTGRTSYEFTLLTQAGVTVLTQPAELLQAQWRELDGLTVNVDSGDSQFLRGLQRSGDFKVIVWTAGGGPALYRMYDLFHTDGVENYGGYSNPEVDAALDVTRNSNDFDEVVAAYAFANGTVAQDPVNRTWRNNSAQFVSSDKVRGVEELAGFGSPFFEQVWVAE